MCLPSVNSCYSLFVLFAALSFRIFLCCSIVLLEIVFFICLINKKISACPVYFLLVISVCAVNCVFFGTPSYSFSLTLSFTETASFFLNFLSSFFSSSFVFFKYLNYILPFFVSIIFDVSLFSILISPALKRMLCCVILFFT